MKFQKVILNYEGADFLEASLKRIDSLTIFQDLMILHDIKFKNSFKTTALLSL
jgi:hypothetical protein